MASIAQRSGILGKRLAHHLVSRLTYNITPSRIEYFATKTASQAVNELLSPTGSPQLWPDGPLDSTGNKIFSDSDYYFQPGFGYSGGNRRRAIETWKAYEAMACTTAKWKIINYFSSIYSVFTQGFIDNFHYWRLLEHMAFSDLKTLALKITYDHQMLRYLNNSVNHKNAPNENYAREFLELFTILKGPQIATGNYTTYTEADVSTAARVLTGIRAGVSANNPDNVDPNTGLIAAINHVNAHDTGNKTFSQAFNNRTIIGQSTAATMTNEIADMIDMIFDEVATAKSYVRKMYTFFVNDEISTEIENDVITPLANKLLLNGYDHILIMKDLFSSVHFYDEDDSNANDEIIGALVKSPYELFYTTKNLVEADHLRIPTDANYYDQIFRLDWLYTISHHLTASGLDTRGPLTVEGYPGWNDQLKSKLWFTTNFVYYRFTYGLSFKRGRIRHSSVFFPYKTDMIAWVERNIDVAGGPGTAQAPLGASDANLLINEMLAYLLVVVPVGDRLCYFQNQLLGGLSTVNWFSAWSDYLTTGVDTEVRIGIERLYDAILASPEFQTF